MNRARTVFFLLVLATFAASGCAAKGDARALADADAEKAEEPRAICSSTAPVGTHMKRVVCRSQEVVDYTSERAQRALRQHSMRKALPAESGGR